ncbi:MAG: hypothetical protein HC803_05830 [Saprospiraceae bacterium]|nr:hypothetical protein [Saprospiraceae bacterium]
MILLRAKLPFIVVAAVRILNTQTFDAFTNCATTWNCNGYVCPLQQNWYNVPFDYQRGDSTEWRTYSGSTPTGATGPSSDHTSGTGKYLYIETSGGSTNQGCQYDEAQALTPCINLSSATKPELAFWYHMYGSSTGSISVDILVDGVWKEVFTKSGEQGNMWIKGTANLIPYVGKTVIFRFRALTGGSFQGDMAIDDITVQENAALPVELISFTAKAINNDFIQLNWQTATEENNRGFEVLRSTDGIHFEKITFVNGQGTTLETSNYTFNDKNVKAGIWYYYQLNQVDFDGIATKTNIVTASLKAATNFAISEPFPNPTSQSASIRININQQLDFDILVYNQLGQMMEQQHFKAGQSNDLVNFDTTKMDRRRLFYCH